MLNIVIPMAGAGSRFANAGYLLPKPLIPIHGIAMIRLVIENLRPKKDHRFIFICQASHCDQYNLQEKLNSWAPRCKIVQLHGVTDGAARSVLAAKEYIDNDAELMIANSDQYIISDINNYLSKLQAEDLGGLIMTMKASDPKWSFVGLSASGHAQILREKEVISDEATVGIYNFRRGRDFVRSAESMIADNQKVNGEFYVAPVYNLLIEEGKKIGIYNIGAEAAGMHGLGIPADLNKFIASGISYRATIDLHENS